MIYCHITGLLRALQYTLSSLRTLSYIDVYKTHAPGDDEYQSMLPSQTILTYLRCLEGPLEPMERKQLYVMIIIPIIPIIHTILSYFILQLSNLDTTALCP